MKDVREHLPYPSCAVIVFSLMDGYHSEAFSAASWRSISSGVKRILIKRAGTPPMMLYGGKERVTTAPAATMLPRPTSTPFRIVTLAPTHTPSPMVTGWSFSGSFSDAVMSMIWRPMMSVRWSPVIIVGRGPNLPLRPIVRGASVQ